MNASKQETQSTEWKSSNERESASNAMWERGELGRSDEHVRVSEEYAELRGSGDSALFAIVTVAICVAAVAALLGRLQ